MLHKTARFLSGGIGRVVVFPKFLQQQALLAGRLILLSWLKGTLGPRIWIRRFQLWNSGDLSLSQSPSMCNMIIDRFAYLTWIAN